METPKVCPVCKANLIGNEIPIKDQHLYGDTHFYRVIGIEVQGGYDGIAYWKCPDCGAEWNRK